MSDILLLGQYVRYFINMSVSQIFYCEVSGSQIF